MLAIRGAPASQQTTVSYLCDVLRVRHHSAVELVNRTEKRGLVSRSREAPDRRLVFVRLTPEGGRLLDDLAAHHLAELLRTAGPELVQALEAILTGRTIA